MEQCSLSKDIKFSFLVYLVWLGTIKIHKQDESVGRVLRRIENNNLTRHSNLISLERYLERESKKHKYVADNFKTTHL